MSYKELFYFTGHCLALDEHPEFRERVIELIQAEGTDLENFVQLCSDHLVIPAIYLKLKAHNLLSVIPEEVVQVFAEIYDLNRERNLQILQQIDDITSQLNKEKIQPVFLKGTANLLDGLYSDVGERMIGDIDFLVKEEDYLKTGLLLEAAGYKKPANNYFDVFRFKHYPPLTKDGEPAYIEIHRLPVDQKYDASLNSELIFSQKKEVPGKPGLFVPSDVHKLIHTFIHSQLADNGHTYKQADFRGLNDLYRISKRINVSELANQTGYPHQANSWFAIGQRLLGLHGRFCPKESRLVQWYCWKYDWSLSHFNAYIIYTSLKKLVHTVFMRYGMGFLQMLYSKKQRISVYKRLKDPKWYRIHVLSLRENF
ncbi:MAG: hypothetical protein C0397_19635 [Odoribacter sp.]|nr:hypothetical protein [Odoribacter sp.]